MEIKAIESKVEPAIPKWMIWVQCVCFSVLYAIWALPETILIRHICLITGALIGLYEIYRYRNLLWQKRAIPIWLIVGLFLWTTFHLIFLSHDFAAQYLEYITIWKRAAIGAIFAIGFGTALANNHFGKEEKKLLMSIFYMALISPSAIYLLKYSLTFLGASFGLVPPEYLRLFYSSAPFYVPKTVYVCFCIPPLAVLLGGLVKNINSKHWSTTKIIFYLLNIMGIFFIFYNENIKNGFIYGLIFLLIFGFQALGLISWRNASRKLFLLAPPLILLISLYIAHIHESDTWRNLFADIRISQQIEKNWQWKYGGREWYPEREPGVRVSGTTFERVSYAIVGAQLLANNKLGYGLVESSFKHLTKIRWPDSNNLTQTHSGWLDLALGIGFPGIALILSALFIVIKNLSQDFLRQRLLLEKSNLQKSFFYIMRWLLIAYSMVWITAELSQRVFFDCLIFILSMGAGVSLVNKNCITKDK